MAWNLLGTIEASERIDRWTGVVRPAVDRLVGAGRRRDLLTGRWLGHAFHPAAVVVPLGCWIGAAVLDLGAGKHARRAARRLVGVGVVGAAPAVASGAADWLDTEGAEQRVGAVHAVANHVAVAAMALSWWLRRRGNHTAGVALSAGGLGAAFTAGMLGGHLAYARGVGVSTVAFQAGPAGWEPLLHTDEIVEGEPTHAALDGVGYVVVGSGDGAYVLENRCTHRGGPLAEGRVIDGCIECPWHGSRFSLRDGRVAAGPASVPQPAYDTRVDDRVVAIRRHEAGGLRRGSVRP